jgi:hypothetical protein
VLSPLRQKEIEPVTGDPNNPDHAERTAAAELALDGLSLGDAFGQQFFLSSVWHTCLRQRELPLPVWNYTDDTVMAISLCNVLRSHGLIDQDDVARGFVDRYLLEPNRGYGPALRGCSARPAREATGGSCAFPSFGGRGRTETERRCAPHRSELTSPATWTRSLNRRASPPR